MLGTVTSWGYKLLTFPPIVLIIPLMTISFLRRLFSSPSQKHDWSDDQKILSYAEIDGDEVTVHNVRNFSYTSTTEYTPRYYTKKYNLGSIKHLWYIVEPFGIVPGCAHTLLSFEFENNTFLAISVEIRKKKGITNYPIKSLFNNYELMYVIADEADVIQLRSNYRKDSVYLYKTKASKKQSRELLLDMLARTNDLYEKPEFFHTITNNCTTNIIRHVNKISPTKISPYSIEAVFPGDSDRLAYTLGLLDSDMTFEETKKRSHINAKAMKCNDTTNFSLEIRDR